MKAIARKKPGWDAYQDAIADAKASPAERRRAIKAALHQKQPRIDQAFLDIQQIYDSAPVGCAVLDADFRYCQVNRRFAEMHGLPRTALLGRIAHEICYGLAAPLSRVRDVLQTDMPYATFEIDVESGGLSDRKRTWTVSCAPLRSAGASRLIGLNVVAEDITERRQAADDIECIAEMLEQRVIERTAELEFEGQERQEAERLLYQLQRVELIGQLTSGIAHDFNNMLGVIRGNVEILARRLTGKRSNLRRFTAGAVAGVERAASLTRQLLSFARRQTLEPRILDLRKWILDMAELFGRTLGEKVTIETVLSDGLWPALADPNQLENALLNLVVNARDAMAGEGRVTIRASNAALDEKRVTALNNIAPGDYLAISVIDSGVGMSPETMALAFEPFFTTKTERGTGLGLAQVYSFAKQSGGHVTIASTPGEGTSVTLYLPRASSLAPIDGAAVDEPAVPAGSIRETVLVVEDDTNVRRSTVDVLRDLGYAVLSAPDGRTALDVIDTGIKIDLLFADVGLPGGLSGPSLAQAAVTRRPGLKVLFATGYSEEPSQVGAESIVSPLLKKPFTYAALAKRVRQALAENTAS